MDSRPDPPVGEEVEARDEWDCEGTASCAKIVQLGLAIWMSMFVVLNGIFFPKRGQRQLGWLRIRTAFGFRVCGLKVLGLSLKVGRSNKDFQVLSSVFCAM